MGKSQTKRPAAQPAAQDCNSPLTEPGKNWKGAEILHQSLLDENVKDMFGYTGGAVLPIFDALYKSPINFILTRHEQGGAHAADAYARATGKVGVVLATSGPGATNLVTGLATAHMDSIPMVAITGQVRSDLIGNDAFQEADMTGITRPITKHNVLVHDIRDLARTIREAFHIARTGRPGPVLVDIPVDISNQTTAGPLDKEMALPGYRPRFKGHLRQIQLAADAINKAQNPVLYVGGGVIISEASDLLRELALKAGIPVTTTLMGLGAFDENHPLALKMLGMHGTAYANYAVQECDLLIAIGARFDDRVTGKVETFAQNAKIIHIDIDPASISKNVRVDIPVVGDAKQILTDLIKMIEPNDRSVWLDKIKEWKQKFPLRYDQENCSNIKPQYVIESLGRLANGDAIVTTGVGQHQMWTAQFFNYNTPRQLITSGGLGTMGFGLPAAIGAQVGRPDKIVIDIDGDASFSMTLMELATIAQYKLPIKIALIRNTFQGMVRQWQEMFYGRRYSQTKMVLPDFCKIAEGFGIKALCIQDKTQVQDVIRESLKYPGPVLMDFEVEPEENVWPMVAPAKSLHEMELGRLA
ncbi:MAG: biosynthetic-type acetolactate synthase large subunit [Phycisphaerae bacterium]|nr:biosynthetic-type acetolactate synthase large subunit [Phycisphaerae bacterium]